MKFNDHSKLEGSHAFLSASNYSWLNYTKDKLTDVFNNTLATKLGSELHELASQLIKYRIKVAKNKKAFYLFVNDCIGYNMESEQVLFYSEYCYGTADAIKFHDNKLMIFDLKTGKHKCKFDQLKIYAALFCLEYDKSPYDISMELRIYQFNTFEVFYPEPEEIRYIMDKIIEFDQHLQKINSVTQRGN